MPKAESRATSVSDSGNGQVPYRFTQRRPLACKGMDSIFFLYLGAFQKPVMETAMCMSVHLFDIHEQLFLSRSIPTYHFNCIRVLTFLQNARAAKSNAIANFPAPAALVSAYPARANSCASDPPRPSTARKSHFSIALPLSSRAVLADL